MSFRRAPPPPLSAWTDVSGEVKSTGKTSAGKGVGKERERERGRSNLTSDSINVFNWKPISG